MEKVIESVGSVYALCKAVRAETGGKCSNAHVAYWRKRRVPAHMVLTLERISGVPRYELRPDLYPPEEYREAG
jgi:hypothetical protein